MKRLNAERAGPRGAATLVLLHPMGADLRFWDDCRALWQDRFDCLAVDLPAAGLSADPGGTLAPRRQAEAVSDVLREQSVSRCVVVGCAVGAMVAVCLAAQAPERATALVLANPGLRTEGAARDSLAARAAVVRAGGMAAVAGPALDAAFGGQPQDDRRAAFARRFAAQDAASYARQIEGILDADVGAEVNALRLPVLVAVGGRDRLLPPAIGRGIATRLPRATLKEYPEAAHFIPFQAPAAFAADVAAWLDGLSAVEEEGRRHDGSR